MKKTVALAIVALICCGVSHAAEPGMARFVGTWIVDLERTLDEARRSPDVSEEELEKMPAVIQRMMQTMVVEIGDTELVYKAGQRRSALPYTVSRVTGPATTVVVTVRERQAEMSFRLVGDGRMMMKSSQSDDMDLYVWKRAE